MGVALRHASARAEEIFALAEEVSRLPLRRLCEEGPLEELTRTRVAQLCAQASGQTGTSVEVANLNAPGQVVLSGDREGIGAATELATRAGARRVIPLSVGGPFHSRYMAAAAAEFASVVEGAGFATPHTPVVLNTSGRAVSDPEALAAELAVQITSPVRWEESVRQLQAMGCSTFIELGPGQVLTGLIRRTLPDANAVSA